MVSAIIAAAGKNRRMEADQKKLGLDIQNKLLLDLHGKPVIIRTLENVEKTGIEESIVVLGHFSDEIQSLLSKHDDDRIKIISNPQIDVQLSETLLNGAKNAKNGLCLCVAADHPMVSTATMKKLIEKALEYPDVGNIVSILAREDRGYLDSAKGLGMPFVCHSKLLKRYLPHQNDNLNPILGDMLRDGVVFYGVPPHDMLELININRWEDYLTVLNQSPVKDYFDE